MLKWSKIHVNVLFIYLLIEKTNATGHEVVWVAPPSKPIENRVHININDPNQIM